MGCPFHDGGESNSEGDNAGDHADPPGDARASRRREDRGIDRRAFMKSALAIGGTSALSTVTGLYGTTRSAAAQASGPSYAARQNRQHAWDAYEVFDEKKETSVPPGRHLLLHLEYQGDGAPTPEDRRTARKAFDELEELAGWGSDGLLFTVGYSASYFDRFDEPLPEGIGPASDSKFAKPSLLRAQTLIDFPGVTLPKEDPTADEYDCAIHLSSSAVERLLAAEILLWGGAADIDGDGEEESLDNTLEGILQTPDGTGRPSEYPYRRVGFAGHDNLESEGGEEEDGVYPSEIPEDAELSMGFNDLFKNSIPREDNVTLLEDQRLVVPKSPGPFAQGTVQHVSKLDLNLDPEDGWYQYDTEERVDRMFSPDHDADGMGEVADEFGNTTAITEENEEVEEVAAVRDLDGEGNDIAERTQEHADEKGVVGHVEKVARARFDMETRITEEGQARLSGGDRDELLPAEERQDDLRGHDGEVQEAEQVMLRRDFDTVDQNEPGLHFVALMRFNPYMAYMRAAMNGVEFDTGDLFGLGGDGEIEHDDLGDILPDEEDAESKYDLNSNGIVGFTETTRRGNYLVPPLTLRALPHPQAETVDITVQRAGENYRVTVDGTTADALADGTVRFGWFYDVNRARGVAPRQVTQRGNRTTFVFPADGTGVDTAPGGPDGDVRVRLSAKRADTGRPVAGTASVDRNR